MAQSSVAASRWPCTTSLAPALALARTLTRPEFASSKNQASEVRYAAPKLIYIPRIEVPRIDLYGLTGLAEDDD